MSLTALLGAAAGDRSSVPGIAFLPVPGPADPVPESAQPAKPAISAVATAPKAILFVAAIIRPPSSSQEFRALQCRHGAVNVARRPRNKYDKHDEKMLIHWKE
ncbi:hypothetical protein OG909_13540 [Streptomyces sp. NBC_01754]|uniref:hypothetical protein n=1 Tax=Streptomyces sp. NBC_01754 TaxID=2975930 RepID=UPI002DDC4DB7|nr:hypothetical protein [Streptomyces sp. NBC_01754]WSC97062.1 hypothetical protein OG909_13540 [Streptomyces sp. NBC_01754]